MAPVSFLCSCGVKNPVLRHKLIRDILLLGDAFIACMLYIAVSEDANALAPAFQSGVQNNLIRERIGVARGYGWYVVLIVVHNVHYLESSFPQS